MSPGADQDGFTLVELLVAMTLMLLVLAATLESFNRFERNAKLNDRQQVAQDRARTATDRMSRELRSAASAGGPTAVTVERAQPYDVVFQRVNPAGASPTNPTGLQRVRYCLETANPARARLWRQTQADVASGLSSSACGVVGSGWDARSEITSDVANQAQSLALWRYGPTDAASGTDATGSAITTVRTDLVVAFEGGSGRTSRLTSAVALRNVNLRPLAAFSVVVTNGAVVLNGSASQDPEGEPLSYSWYQDDAPLSQDDERVGPLAVSPGSHAYRLTVRDPSGLSADAPTQTVVVG